MNKGKREDNMLLKITTKCNMNCSHCFNSCSANGINMSWPDITSSIDFINRVRAKCLILTGGEPTEHPDFIDVTKYICKNTKAVIKIIIASNGIYFEKNPLVVKELLAYDSRIGIQITNVPEYYPISIDENNEIYKLDRVLLCREIESMYPQGNALKNNYKWSAKCSKCFNFISIMNQLTKKSIEKTIYTLESNFKFCTPQIDADGTLKPGESSLCKGFGTIYDDEVILVHNVLNFRCKQCDFINKNLPKSYQQLINIK